MPIIIILFYPCALLCKPHRDRYSTIVSSTPSHLVGTYPTHSDPKKAHRLLAEGTIAGPKLHSGSLEQVRVVKIAPVAPLYGTMSGKDQV